MIRKKKSNYFGISTFLNIMKVLKNFQKRNYTVAVLVDADNVEPSLVSFALHKVEKEYGKVVIRRIYANWNNQKMIEKWGNYIKTNHFLKKTNYSHTRGKNSTDISMVIDAMDILHQNDIDIFCVISSDSDFTNLAYRLRENSKFIIGVGSNATEQTQQAYDKYYLVVEHSEEKLIVNFSLDKDIIEKVDINQLSKISTLDREKIINEKIAQDLKTAYNLVSARLSIVSLKELYEQYNKIDEVISFIHYNKFVNKMKTIEYFSIDGDPKNLIVKIKNPS